MDRRNSELIQFLDIGAVWVRALAAAVARRRPALGWLAEPQWTGRLQSWEELRDVHPRLDALAFPVQRGYHRRVLSMLFREDARIADRIADRCAEPRHSPLVLQVPHYYRVAERWPGPTVYLVTDNYRYCWDDTQRIRQLEMRMADAADLICPNSVRIERYLTAELGVPGHRVRVLPNAARPENLLDDPLEEPLPFPDDLPDLKRPVAGVVGNLAANTDWCLLEAVVDRTPWLDWLLIGPTHMEVPDEDQRAARRRLMDREDGVHFTGRRPYEDLAEYKRSLDVAVLPYRKREPTYSGSSVRYYEHLAATRPMVASNGFHELLDKEPVVTITRSADEMVEELDRLRVEDFQDGLVQERWKRSQQETWDQRAARLVSWIDGIGGSNEA